MIRLSKFKHLSISEREKIFLWYNTGLSNREIATRLKRDHRCINEEIKRNTKYGNKYSPNLAQKRAERIGISQRSKAPLKSLETYLYVREHLRPPHYWTPEMISGRIGKDIKGANISIESIYQYIYSKKARQSKLWEYLPCGRKKRRKKYGRKVRNNGKIPNSISIDLRPKSIDKRKKPGHWETDNVEGCRSTKPALSVTVERSIRCVDLKKIKNQTSDEKVKAIRKHFSKCPPALRKSMTQDNGKENTKHELISKELGLDMYFCHAYHSWEKGSVENRNRVVRRFFPKGTDFTRVTNKEIEYVQQVINNMPLKCLNYDKPSERMSQLMSKFNST